MTDRDKIKQLEQEWMALKDQYSEIARALGFEGDPFFGDPYEDHEVILRRAKTCYKEYCNALKKNQK